MIQKALIVIVTAIVFKTFLEYTFGSNKSSVEQPPDENKTPIFNLHDLQTKSNEQELYLSILGNVYDVSKGAKHYMKGGSYEFFVGKDASRAFVTGDFVNDLNDKVDDLTQAQISDLFNWKKFYDDNYKYIGVFDGRFYDSNGKKTDYLLKIEEVNNKQKEVDKLNSEFSSKFPSCNSEWTQEKGLTKLWCSTESGGIARDWTGLPRRVFNPNTKQEGCACVNEIDLDHPSVKLYPNCDPKSATCNPQS